MKVRLVLVACSLLACAVAPLAAYAGTTTVAVGTTMQGVMDQSLDSGTAQIGQRFSMQLVAPYPNYDAGTWAGSKANAHVVYIQRAGQGRKPELSFVFDHITLRNGASAKLHADLVSVERKQGSSVGYTVLAAAGGMVIGNIIGKWLGTNAGGAVGAVAGALYGINKKTNFTVPSGSKVVFELSQPLTVNTLARAVPATVVTSQSQATTRRQTATHGSL
ncbi:MAG: hypothetical protein M3Z41_00075 [Candidatus Eremiobacteraeota bacterium]|nr:hypothetical protein [Candidatus Eremiobacteraeota bacterium]